MKIQNTTRAAFDNPKFSVGEIKILQEIFYGKVEYSEREVDIY